jgi:hypothetical protein
MIGPLSGNVAGSRRSRTDSPSMMPLADNWAFSAAGVTRIQYCARFRKAAGTAWTALACGDVAKATPQHEPPFAHAPLRWRTQDPPSAAEHKRAGIAINVRNEKTPTKPFPTNSMRLLIGSIQVKRSEPKS